MTHFLRSAFSLATVLCLAGASNVLAQSGGGKGMIERFKALDTDGNGQFDASEATEWNETVFLAMDYDDDGQLTTEEYMAVQLGQGADPAQRGPRYAKKQLEKNARFTDMDADRDGYGTLDQFLADGQLQFIAADADNNGAISISEFIAAN